MGYQDAKGLPTRSLNSPLHFSYGTMFLAPGPVAQLFPIPEDEALIDEMRRAQTLWRFIYDSYNFDPDPDPDSSFSDALEFWAQSMYQQDNVSEERTEL